MGADGSWITELPYTVGDTNQSRVCLIMATKPLCVWTKEWSSILEYLRCWWLAPSSPYRQSRSLVSTEHSLDVPSASRLWNTAHRVDEIRYHQITLTPRRVMTFIQYHNHFTALFPGPPRSAGARTQLLDFMVQRKINRGRHTDHQAGCHSIPINQCQSAYLHHPPFFTGRMPFLLPNQQCQSTEGNTFFH